ncbi:aromatic ring-hydroxylating dioxygenase subunit alpha [Glaciimonas immobilis]|uniref:Vanillate O-demethylase monooxygenase subunit n=1 Tax=Glaciimonas immobilis TaxID=728004 RepID=A0A840RQV8_9BURK|nr:aromatic ring-hydroxylating dioxygenase subunit alpha [Glaciimonas immobilis]KAF3998182.1 aromatic ring-hydroxylating dioxygenase subunit alpha [Glaciimonas immobilis]MBB5199104.1 vanillate O-demethylase monooxygenase subunit [Glaciimonas immobilis]
MFVYNAWYMGAWADEVKTQGLLGRVLLNQPVVFYRTEDGTALALEDRCCHRALPLSHGCVVGDQLQCGYHGLVYDRNGLCVKVPGQERVPAQARVRSYPVVEKDHMLWIWMGEPALANPALIVAHPWHDDDAWVWIKDRYSIKSAYQLVTDNLMDLTHVGYVHQRTIGGTPQAHSDADTQTTRSETGVKVIRWMMDSVPPPSYVAAHKFNTPTVDRWMEIDFFPPAIVRIHTGATDAGTGAREGNREGGMAFMGLNLQTPETETTTHYFWSGAHTYDAGGLSKADLCSKLLASLTVTFAEDKVVVEAQQQSLDRLEGAPLVMIASDAGLAHARRMVAVMIENEAAASKAALNSEELSLAKRDSKDVPYEN